MDMAMSPEEKFRFETLQKRVEELDNDVNDFKQEVSEVKSEVKRILTLVRGIAIGLAIGGAFFGMVKFPELIKFFTK